MKIGGGAVRSDLCQLLAALVATLLPEMERSGVATAAEIGLETLLERLNHEAGSNSSVLVGHFQVGAWVRL